MVHPFPKVYFFSREENISLLIPLTPKIWLSILPSSYYTFPCKLITRFRCSIKLINRTWWVWVFSSTVYCLYYREKLHGNRFKEWKGLKVRKFFSIICISHKRKSNSQRKTEEICFGQVSSLQKACSEFDTHPLLFFIRNYNKNNKRLSVVI